MSDVGEVLFDRSVDNQEEVWDDTELIRAYDRAHRQIQNRLRNQSKTKKDSSKNSKKEKSFSTNTKSKPKKDEPSSTITTGPTPMPIPINMMTPPKDEQDALHSMLMAWYMAGYHAGQLAAKNIQKQT